MRQKQLSTSEPHFVVRKLDFNVWPEFEVTLNEFSGYQDDFQTDKITVNSIVFTRTREHSRINQNHVGDVPAELLLGAACWNIMWRVGVYEEKYYLMSLSCGLHDWAKRGFSCLNQCHIQIWILSTYFAKSMMKQGILIDVDKNPTNNSTHFSFWTNLWVNSWVSLCCLETQHLKRKVWSVHWLQKSVHLFIRSTVSASANDRRKY